MDTSRALENPRVRRLLVALGIFAAVGPPLVAAIVLHSRGWFPTSDLAQAELRMQAFWSHPPQIGAAGRIGPIDAQGSHPGPIAWWAMWPAYWLFGSTAGALSIAVALLASAWISVSVVLAYRQGGLAGALSISFALALTVRALGPLVFVEPWNPWLGIFPFAAMLMFLWRALSAHPMFVVGAVFAGSFSMQQHVGYVPIVGALVGGTIVWLLIRSADRRHAWIALGGSIGIGLVSWALPLYQQVRNSPGNLTVLWESFSAPEENPIGFGAAIRVMSGVFSPVGTWAVKSNIRPEDRAITLGFLVMALLWFALGIMMFPQARRRIMRGTWCEDVAARCGRRGVQPLVALLSVALVVSIVSISRIFGAVFDYLLEWAVVTSALCAALLAIVFWDTLCASTSRSNVDTTVVRNGCGAFFVLSALLLTVISSNQFADVETPGKRLSEQMGELTHVAPLLDPKNSYVVRWSDPVALGALGFGTINELERRGFDVGADPVFRTAVLPHRVKTNTDADQALWVITGGNIDKWEQRSDAEKLIEVDARTPEERRIVDSLRTEVRNELFDVGGESLASLIDVGYWNVILDPRFPSDLADEIDVLGDLGLPTAIFVTAPTAAPLGS